MRIIESVLVHFASFALIFCYSPFHKQPIGPAVKRNGPWINQFATSPTDGANRTLRGGFGSNVFDLMFQ